MRLAFHRMRFWLLARRPLDFRAGAANRLRGLLGSALRRVSCLPDCRDPDACPHGRACLYGQVFAPHENSGPSGLRDRPRPFVLRPPLPGAMGVAAGERFPTGLHLFDRRPETVSALVAAFAHLGDEDLARAETLDLSGGVRGPLYNHGRLCPAPPPVWVELAAPAAPVRRLRVEFLTPVELKGGDFTPSNPSFGVLFARARDRVANLIRLYGEPEDAAGLEQVDFAGLGRRAREVRCAHARLQPVDAARTSRRTGQTHGLGGLVGEAVYEGELREFLPWLEAAGWTGAGRQTVWGKGVLRVSTAEP